MIIDAVVPVRGNVEFTVGFLYSITQCEIKPRKLYVIDNGSQDPTQRVCKDFLKELPCMEYIRFEENIGVNPAWNLAFERSDADHIWILNNDMILNNKFFERSIQFFEKYPNCQMAQAFDIADPKRVNEPVEDTLGIDPGLNMVGYAFTVSKHLLEVSGLIPESMFIYCGDQWLFDIAKEEGMQILLMQHNYLYHYISRTCNAFKTLGTYFPTDLAEWQRLTKERCSRKGVPLPWNVIPWN
jgi:GT2 family glycosyltransferase